MNTKRLVLPALLAPLLLAGCLIERDHHRGGDVVYAPALPPVVVLGPEPYYVHGGYHYYYRDGGWSYSHARGGPWTALPRNRYPKEVRYKDGGHGHDDKRSPGHKGR